MRNIQYQVFYPSVMYQDIDGAIVTVQDAPGILAAGAAGTTLISATSGKQIRVLSMHFASAGAATSISLKSSGGGLRFGPVVVPANTVVSPNVVYPNQEIGWCDTATGEGLTADGGAVNIIYSIRFVVFTPTT